MVERKYIYTDTITGLRLVSRHHQRLNLHIINRYTLSKDPASRINRTKILFITLLSHPNYNVSRQSILFHPTNATSSKPSTWFTLPP